MTYVLILVICIVFALLYGELLLTLFSIAWRRLRTLYGARSEMKD